jgi:hypothetical protein
MEQSTLNVARVVGVMHNQAELDKFLLEYPQKLASEGYQKLDRKNDKLDILYPAFSKLDITIKPGEIYEYTHDPYKLLVSRGGMGVMISFVKNDT